MSNKKLCLFSCLLPLLFYALYKIMILINITNSKKFSSFMHFHFAQTTNLTKYTETLLILWFALFHLLLGLYAVFTHIFPEFIEFNWFILQFFWMTTNQKQRLWYKFTDWLYFCKFLIDINIFRWMRERHVLIIGALEGAAEIKLVFVNFANY